MAVTAIWNVKGRIGNVIEYAKNPEKTISPESLRSARLAETEQGALMNVIGYASQEKKVSGKTAGEHFISGINCDPDDAAFEMTEVKKQYGKLSGNTAYHAYQSFAKGETTPEVAHEIGKKLAIEIWGDRFQVVVATHLDKDHLHTHFIVNSVSFKDGGKYNDCKATYRKIRDASDRLCREYGLSVIEKPAPGKTKHYSEWRAEKDGKPTWRSAIKADVDEAIKGSMTDTQFFAALRQKGYEIKSGKDISVRPPGKERFFRLARNFGEGYALESIRLRILAQQRSQRPAPSSAPKRSRCHRILPVRKRRRVGGLMGLYLHYQYLLGNLPKRGRGPRHGSFALKADIAKLDRISAETKMLFRYGIETECQLAAFRDGRQAGISRLAGERDALRKDLRKEPGEGKKEAIRQKIADATAALKGLRREAKLADDIAARSGAIRENISNKTIGENQREKQKEAKKDERFRRGR